MNTQVKNILSGKEKAGGALRLFSARTIIIMIILAAFSFSAYFVLSGFSNELRETNDGGEHALSKSAIGFAGLVHVLQADGQSTSVSRLPKARQMDRKRLRIVTIPVRNFPVGLDDIELKQPTLIVLPKWHTHKLASHKGWVKKYNTPNSPTISKFAIIRKLNSVVPSLNIKRSDNDSQRITVSAQKSLNTLSEYKFYNFDNLQTISGKKLIPLFESEQGTILAQLENSNTFVLSDPDFLNTHGVSRASIRKFALNIIHLLQERTGTQDVVFDISLHGFSGSRNMIKLALSPPFLGATLSLLAMVALIIWQAFVRFGEPERTKQPIAFGKRSLIETSSNFIEHAGRTHRLFDTYKELTRDEVLRALNIPKGLKRAEQDKRLASYASRDDNIPAWQEIAQHDAKISNNTELLERAKQIYKWRGDMTHEHK